MFKKVSALLLFFAFATPSFSAIVTFDPPPCSTCGYILSSYEESGVLFTGSFIHYGMATTGNAKNNSTGALRFPTPSFIQIEQANGALFSLQSVDLAEYSSVFEGIPVTILFTGVKADNTVVQQSFTIDGLIDGIGGIDDFQNFTFSPAFSGLSYATVSTDVFSMDNLEITTVPLPAAVYLFVAGLAGLLGWRKKRL